MLHSHCRPFGKSLSNPVHKIEIADEQSRSFESQSLISAVTNILTDHGILRSELSIAVVDDPTIRQLNQQYLNHDYATDVISFILDHDEDTGWLSGQLIVSSDTADSMARKIGGSMQDELLLYVVHGTLHLVGFNDKIPSEAAEMRTAEKKYLTDFGVEYRWSHDEATPDDCEEST